MGLVLTAFLAAAIGLAGFPVEASFRALGAGVAGSIDALFSATLVRATPLMLAGLGVALAFRAGVLNIGAEGQLVMGAAAASAIGIIGAPWFGSLTMPIALAGSAIAGVVWTVIPAWLRHRFAVLEVISTIMMNFLALHVTSFLVRGPLQEPTHIYPQSSSIALAARLPTLFADTRLHWGFVLAVLLCLLAEWVVGFTAAGFRLQAAGANPTAAREAGQINVRGLTARVFLASGALAGLAGGVQLTGVTYALYDNLSPGYGYAAIAVALLAGRRPAWVIPSSILFGALDAGSAAMQRDVGVPAGFVSAVQALVMLALLATPALAASLPRLRAPSWRNGLRRVN